MYNWPLPTEIELFKTLIVLVSFYKLPPPTDEALKTETFCIGK